MIGLDLFSGIGGLTIAMEGVARPVAYCENDRFAQAVLLSRQRDGGLPIAPIWNDVRTLKANVLPSRIDIIWGGFPCQDISVAGTGRGLEGKRSGLFFEIIRLISDIRPRFVFLENVPAISIRGLDRILLEFNALGYDCRWTIVSAQEIGACHIRERWFLLAHSNGERLWKKSRTKYRWDTLWSGEVFTDSISPSWKIREASSRLSQPTVCRANDGVPNRVDRNKSLGNAVVPEQARLAFKKLITMGAL